MQQHRVLHEWANLVARRCALEHLHGVAWMQHTNTHVSCACNGLAQDNAGMEAANALLRRELGKLHPPLPYVDMHAHSVGKDSLSLYIGGGHYASPAIDGRLVAVVSTLLGVAPGSFGPERFDRAPRACCGCRGNGGECNRWGTQGEHCQPFYC